MNHKGHDHKPQDPPAVINQPMGALGYAVIGFAGLAVALLVGWYITQRLDVLAAFSPQAYYVLLTLLGIAVAVFLFGVLRSGAKLTGSSLGYTVELGGPIVAAALLIYGGYQFGIPAGEFALTVFLRGDKPADELARNAVLVVDIEGRRDRVAVAGSGEATIKGIPSRLRNSEIPINLESSSYRLKDQGHNFKIPANAVIYVDVVPINETNSIAGPIGRLIHPAFQAIYDVAPQLKSVRGPAHLSSDAYQAVYENAHVLWIRELMTIFVLPNDPNRKLIRYQETSWATDSDLFDEAKARIIFKTPEGKHPPHGGIANLWRNDPESWKWLGWLEWHCRFLKKVYYQEFEGGVVFGDFRTHPTLGSPQIVAVLDNGTWHSQPRSDQAPKCENIFEQFPQ